MEKLMEDKRIIVGRWIIAGPGSNLMSISEHGAIHEERK